MINFYPGPSKIHEQYPEIASELLTSGLVSFNHRSKEFSDGYNLSVNTLKEKLALPTGYDVVFLSSATECWETICQSFSKKKSLFLYNGAFGKKWMEQGKFLMDETTSVNFDINETITSHLNDDIQDLVCYVQNETSNGTCVLPSEQKKIRSHYQNALIAVDATSSLGADNISYIDTDICFSSVQKCMGMPAGLAVMILSPKAIIEIENRTKSLFYNDLTNNWTNHKKSQTTHTPNTLGILSIGKLHNTLPSLSTINQQILDRKARFEKIIADSSCFDFIIKEKELRSNTVFCLTHNNPSLVIYEALKNGIILGKGYGNWKKNTIRIANFPAHTEKDFEILINFIKQCK